jgi:hypothetical protein
MAPVCTGTNGPLGKRRTLRDQLGDQLPELRRVDGLLQVVDGAELECSHGGRHRSMAGHHHHRGGGRLIAQLADQIQPTLARQLQVGDDDGVGAFAETRQRLLGRSYGLELVTGLGQ